MADTVQPIHSNLLFNTRDELTKVNLEYVVYFEADGNYTHVIFSNGCKTILLISLTDIEHLIDDVLKGQVQPFIRIGKRYIVNSSFIFQINVLKQKLLLTNFNTPHIFTLSISKEALKNLKNLYAKKVKTYGNHNRTQRTTKETDN